jgi:hypothetical protein
MPRLRFDANGKKSLQNRLEEMLFVLLHPITQKALCATFSTPATNIRDWSNAAHEPNHLNALYTDEISAMPQRRNQTKDCDCAGFVI